MKLRIVHSSVRERERVSAVCIEIISPSYPLFCRPLVTNCDTLSLCPSDIPTVSSFMLFRLLCIPFNSYISFPFWDISHNFLWESWVLCTLIGIYSAFFFFYCSKYMDILFLVYISCSFLGFLWYFSMEENTLLSFMFRYFQGCFFWPFWRRKQYWFFFSFLGLLRVVSFSVAPHNFIFVVPSFLGFSQLILSVISFGSYWEFLVLFRVRGFSFFSDQSYPFYLFALVWPFRYQLGLNLQACQITWFCSLFKSFLQILRFLF